MFKKVQRYSIRKLTIGAASVLIGIAFVGVDANVVHAQTTPTSEAKDATNSKQTSDTSKESSISAPAQPTTASEQASSQSSSAVNTSDKGNTDNQVSSPVSAAQKTTASEVKTPATPTAPTSASKSVQPSQNSKASESAKPAQPTQPVTQKSSISSPTQPTTTTSSKTTTPTEQTLNTKDLEKEPAVGLNDSKIPDTGDATLITLNDPSLTVIHGCDGNTSKNGWKGDKTYQLAINGGATLNNIPTLSVETAGNMIKAGTREIQDTEWVMKDNEGNYVAVDSTHHYDTNWSKTHNTFTAYIRVTYKDGKKDTIIPVTVGIRSDAEQYDQDLFNDLAYINTHTVYQPNAPHFSNGSYNTSDTQYNGDIPKNDQLTWGYDINNVGWKSNVSQDKIDNYKKVIQTFQTSGRHRSPVQTLSGTDGNGDKYDGTQHPGMNVLYKDGSSTSDVWSSGNPCLIPLHTYEPLFKHPSSTQSTANKWGDRYSYQTGTYQAVAGNMQAFTPTTAKDQLTNLANEVAPHQGALFNFTQNYSWVIADPTSNSIDGIQVTGFRKLTANDIKKEAGTKETLYIMVRYTKTANGEQDGYDLLPVDVTLTAGIHVTANTNASQTFDNKSVTTQDIANDFKSNRIGLQTSDGTTLNTTGLTGADFEWVDNNGEKISDPIYAGTYYLRLTDAGMKQLKTDNGSAKLGDHTNDIRYIIYAADAKATLSGSNSKPFDNSAFQTSQLNQDGQSGSIGIKLNFPGYDSTKKDSHDNNTYILQDGDYSWYTDNISNYVNMHGGSDYGPVSVGTYYLRLSLQGRYNIEQWVLNTYGEKLADSLDWSKGFADNDHATFTIKQLHVKFNLTGHSGKTYDGKKAAIGQVDPMPSKNADPNSHIYIESNYPKLEYLGTEPGDLTWTDKNGTKLDGEPKDVGTYSLGISDAMRNALEYELTLTAGKGLDGTTDNVIFDSISSDATYTIKQGNATAKLAGSNSRDYDGTAVSINDLYNGGSIQVAISFPGATSTQKTFKLSNGDYTWNTQDGSAPTDVGTYTITLTKQGITDIEKQINKAAGNGNVQFVDQNNKPTIGGSATFTIHKLSASSVMSGSYSKIYDGTETTNPDHTKFSFKVKVNGNDVDLTLPSDLSDSDFEWVDESGNVVTTKPKNVGTYYVKLTDTAFAKLQNANPNFTLTNTGSGTYTITPASKVIVHYYDDTDSAHPTEIAGKSKEFTSSAQNPGTFSFTPSDFSKNWDYAQAGWTFEKKDNINYPTSGTKSSDGNYYVADYNVYLTVKAPLKETLTRHITYVDDQGNPLTASDHPAPSDVTLQIKRTYSINSDGSIKLNDWTLDSGSLSDFDKKFDAPSTITDAAGNKYDLDLNNNHYSATAKLNNTDVSGVLTANSGKFTFANELADLAKADTYNIVLPYKIENAEIIVHYIDVTGKTEPSTGWQNSDGSQVQTATSSVNANSSTYIKPSWDYAGNGWELVQDANWPTKSGLGGSKTDLYIYLKAANYTTETITRQVKYVDGFGNALNPTDSTLPAATATLKLKYVPTIDNTTGKVTGHNWQLATAGSKIADFTAPKTITIDGKTYSLDTTNSHYNLSNSLISNNSETFSLAQNDLATLVKNTTYTITLPYLLNFDINYIGTDGKTYDGQTGTIDPSKVNSWQEKNNDAELTLPTGETLSIPTNWVANTDFHWIDKDGNNASAPTNVGTYYIALTQDGINKLKAANSNYKINNITGKITYTIAAQALNQITYSGSHSRDYNGNAATVGDIDNQSFTSTDLKNTDHISFSGLTDDDFDWYKDSVSAANKLNSLPKDVGHYILVLNNKGLSALASQNTSKNYTFPTALSDFSGQMTYDIKPAEINQVTFSGQDGKTYDAKAGTINTSKAGNWTPSITLPNGESLNIPTWDTNDFKWDTTDGKAPINASDTAYKIVLTDSGKKKLENANSNYKIDNIDGAIDYTITKENAKAVFAGQGEKTYDGSPIVTYTTPIGVTITAPGVDKPLSLTAGTDYVWKKDGKTYTSAPVDAGSYTIELTAAGKNKIKALNADNLNWTISGSGTYTINKAQATVKFTDASGQAVNYNGKTGQFDSNKFVPTISTNNHLTLNIPNGVSLSLAAGDFTINGVETTTEPTELGTYTIGLSKQGFKKLQSATNNYDWSNEAQAEYIIQKAKNISVTIHGEQSETYKDAAYNNDDINVNNYRITLGNGKTYTLQKGDLQFVPSEDPTNVGSYKIELSKQGQDNITKVDSKHYSYNLDNVTGTFTITKATPTVKFNGNGTKTYDGSAPKASDYTTPISLTITAPGNPTITLGNGDYQFVGSDGTVYASDHLPVNVGTYTIELTNQGQEKITNNTDNSANLDWSKVDLAKLGTGSFKITPKAITVNYSGTDGKTYNGNPGSFSQGKISWTDPGLIGTDHLNISGLTADDFDWYDSEGHKLASAPSDAGRYTLKLNDAGLTALKTGLSNYAITISGKLNYTINPQPEPPTQPTEPTKPTQPTGNGGQNTDAPTQPTQASQNTKASSPSKPTAPAKPTSPAKPSKPGKPAKPNKPHKSKPNKPGKPTKPNKVNKPSKGKPNKGKTTNGPIHGEKNTSKKSSPWSKNNRPKYGRMPEGIKKANRWSNNNMPLSAKAPENGRRANAAPELDRRMMVRPETRRTDRYDQNRHSFFGKKGMLPETGEDHANHNILTAVGMAITSLVGLFGFASRKKKKDE